MTAAMLGVLGFVFVLGLGVVLAEGYDILKGIWREATRKF